MKFFILLIFTFQTCFAQKQSTSTVSLVNTDLVAIKFVYQAANNFADLESMINFIGVVIGKVDQLSALKMKIGRRNLRQKISNVKLENNILIFKNERINIKNGKIYFNQELEIPFNPKLNLAENYDQVISSLKKYKNQKKSVLFDQLIPSAYALVFELGQASSKELLVMSGILALAYAVVIVMTGGAAIASAAGVMTGILVAAGGLLIGSSFAMGSSFLENYNEICQPKGSGGYSNSYINNDGTINETNFMLKDGLLVMTLTSNNKHKRTLTLVPNSDRVVQEYDANKNLIPPDSSTMITKEESESLYSMYKACADPELRKNLKARISAYSKLQNPVQSGGPRENTPDSVR